MTENKTKPELADPRAFVEAVQHPQKRDDGLTLLDLMREESGKPPVMWGPSMIGYGEYHYTYETGREGDMFIVGFSPRASAISLYMFGGADAHQDLLAKLGKHKTGKSCIYVNKLADVDLDVIRAMVRRSIELSSAAH
jgi:hypothetical protein